MMEGETVFVQTDPTFKEVLAVSTELKNQNRLHVTRLQTACIKDIESNDKREDHRLVFGGERAANMAFVSFGQTASAVVRMCMLEAVGIRRTFWPQIGPRSDGRNRDKLERVVSIGPLFCLANDRGTARYYWWKYDQLYPHFRIEGAVRGLDINQRESMPSMMLIFRNNFTELIEITTTFNTTRREEHRFNSYVHVACIVREIREGEDGPHTIRLKALMQPFNISVEYFDQVMSLRNVEDAQNLQSPLRDEDEETEADDNGKGHKEDSEEESTKDSKKNAN